MKVQVTQDDINKGSPGSRCYCPVALALKRVLPADHIPFVIAGYVAVAGAVHGEWRRETLPETVITFIHKFDGNKPVEPFEFEIPDANWKWLADQLRDRMERTGRQSARHVRALLRLPYGHAQGSREDK